MRGGCGPSPIQSHPRLDTLRASLAGLSASKAELWVQQWALSPAGSRTFTPSCSPRRDRLLLQPSLDPELVPAHFLRRQAASHRGFQSPVCPARGGPAQRSVLVPPAVSAPKQEVRQCELFTRRYQASQNPELQTPAHPQQGALRGLRGLADRSCVAGLDLSSLGTHLRQRAVTSPLSQAGDCPLGGSTWQVTGIGLLSVPLEHFCY